MWDAVSEERLLLALASAVIFTMVKISRICHLYLQFYLSALHIVVKIPVPYGHLLFIRVVSHATLEQRIQGSV
jgi:hypothetical protein